jgi:membrane associated rhomboid family serine protease
MFLPIGDDVQRDRPPFVGLTIVLACVLVFIKSVRVHAADPLPYGEQLMAWYKVWGLSGKDLATGQWIGVFTHMFVHAGFMHILGNMLVLWAFVWTLEAVLGSGRFLALYVVCGLAAGGVHAFFSGAESEIPLVGASGAIAGVIGAYCLKFGPSTQIKCLFFFFGRPFRVNLPAATFAGIWVLTQLYGQMTSHSEGGGVAWLAHLVGFAAGSLLMPLLYDESRGHLATDKDGTIVIRRGNGDTVLDPRKLPFAFDRETETITCQGCEAELDTSCRVSPGLWLCPDKACKRLNYAIAQPQPRTEAPVTEPVAT